MMTRHIGDNAGLGIQRGVPESNVTDGGASPDLTEGQGGASTQGAAMKILSGKNAPTGASIAVQHNGQWFWIAETDIRSKSIFGTVMLLFSICDIKVKATATIVNVPAQG